jgi:hypothetical protein
MVEQTDFFDPARHAQPPPVIPLRPDGLAPPPRPAPPPPPPAPTPAGAAHWRPTEPIQDVVPAYVKMARQLSIVLATRFLLLIAVITSSAVWGLTIWRPEELRIIAASAFSILGVAPLIWLYVRKG